MSAIPSSLGVLRILLGHPISYYIIGGYVIVVAVTFFAPVEIIGLAYDSGGVTTSTVTVPLVAALGIGLSYLFRTDTNDGYMICNSSACFGHEKDMHGVKEVLKRRKGESNDD